MIIYNVTVGVDHSIAAEWLTWMKEEHIPELMATGLFEDARLCKILMQDETEGLTYTAQYFCKTMSEYDSYISDHADTMRAKGIDRFGDKFVAFRTIMEIVS
ncbi:MAG: DUF4286 family protein [Flavipsychrobacter sp.]